MTGRSRPEPVSLTVAEQTLLARVSFDTRKLTYQQVKKNGRVVAALVASLLDRAAIPEIRLRYLNDAALNVGGHGASRLGVFEGNGCSLEETVTHPNFLPYLRYFLSGPALPAAVVDGFLQILADDLGTEGGLREELRAFARRAVREHSFPRRHAAEEFFKLALECGLELSDGGSIREAVRQTR